MIITIYNDCSSSLCLGGIWTKIIQRYFFANSEIKNEKIVSITEIKLNYKDDDIMIHGSPPCGRGRGGSEKIGHRASHSPESPPPPPSSPSLPFQINPLGDIKWLLELAQSPICSDHWFRQSHNFSSEALVPHSPFCPLSFRSLPSLAPSFCQCRSSAGSGLWNKNR